MTDIVTNLEIVEALETLEYHDRNYLSQPMASPDKCNTEKRRLLREALDLARTHTPKDQS